MNKNHKLLIVLWTILISGSVVFMHYYKIAIIIYSILILSYIIRYKVYIVSFKSLYPLVGLFGFFLVFLILVHRDFSDLGSYAHFFVRICLVASIPMILTFKEFRELYVKVIFFLAVTSLIIYSGALLFREIIYLFPQINSHGSAYYFNLFLAVYHIPLPTYLANSSVFWEGGAYQAFLNLAIAFELVFNKLENKKRLFILILSVITTHSTTGYIILVFQLAFFLFVEKSITSKWLNHILRVLLATMLLWFIFSSIFQGIVLNKFSEGSYSFIVRLTSTLTDLTIFGQSPIFGSGISDYQDMVKSISYSKYLISLQGSVNSLTQFLAMYGLIISCAFLYGYYKFASILGSPSKIRKWVYFVVLIIFFSTENFFTSIIFLSFLSYGIIIGTTNRIIISEPTHL